MDFSGRTVGIIGTGSSGVQSIPVIAGEAAHLTVFQRTPNYNLPANNAPLPEDYQVRIKSNYSAECAKPRGTRRSGSVSSVEVSAGLGSYPEPEEEILKTTEEERQRVLDEEGFEAIRRYNDLALDPKANEMACDMFREQVARVVNDPRDGRGPHATRVTHMAANGR